MLESGRMKQHPGCHNSSYPITTTEFCVFLVSNKTQEYHSETDGPQTVMVNLLETQAPNCNSEHIHSSQHANTATKPEYTGFNLQTTQTLKAKHNSRDSLETHSTLQHVWHRFTNTD